MIRRWMNHHRELVIWLIQMTLSGALLLLGGMATGAVGVMVADGLGLPVTPIAFGTGALLLVALHLWRRRLA